MSQREFMGENKIMYYFFINKQIKLLKFSTIFVGHKIQFSKSKHSTFNVVYVLIMLNEIWINN